MRADRHRGKGHDGPALQHRVFRRIINEKQQHLLAGCHQVTAVCTKPDKAELINHFGSPIQDAYIEKFFAEAAAGTRKLSLTATTDGESAYADADISQGIETILVEEVPGVIRCDSVMSAPLDILDPYLKRKEEQYKKLDEGKEEK